MGKRFSRLTGERLAKREFCESWVLVVGRAVKLAAVQGQTSGDGSRWRVPWAT